MPCHRTLGSNSSELLRTEREHSLPLSWVGLLSGTVSTSSATTLFSSSTQLVSQLLRNRLSSTVFYRSQTGLPRSSLVLC
ncbi:hypothetical protein FOWG_14426 [Fusarium oxysporum f. sp. lycopersici MN25]|nr:hypothetical protein FOWG_14426 [Fusarium oxysporum f. sp. lycopersici MN25]